MSRFLKVFAIALLSIFVLVPAASAQHRVFISGGFVGFGPGRGWYGPGWGWYGPGWYGPWGWGWGYPYAYAPTPSSGQVKLVDVAKGALVYIDGGYAGTAGNLKKFALRPGNHNIELRDPSGHAFHEEKIHVIAGKTLEIHGDTGGRQPGSQHRPQ
jgi:hypothetical protein